MLGYAFAFFVLAVLAAFFGFSTPESFPAQEAYRIAFVVFVVLFLITLVAGLVREPR